VGTFIRGGGGHHRSVRSRDEGRRSGRNAYLAPDAPPRRPATPLPPVPPGGIDPGTPRAVADAQGEAVGIEVWTGAAWLPVRDVGYVASSHRAREAVLAQASIVITRLRPAPMPAPKDAPWLCDCGWRGIAEEIRCHPETGDPYCPHCGRPDRFTENKRVRP